MDDKISNNLGITGHDLIFMSSADLRTRFNVRPHEIGAMSTGELTERVRVASEALSCLKGSIGHLQCEIDYLQAEILRRQMEPPRTASMDKIVQNPTIIRSAKIAGAEIFQR